MTPVPNVASVGPRARAGGPYRAIRRGVAGLACLSLLLGLPSCGSGDAEAENRPDLFTVTPTTLRISVKENGELASAEQTLIKSQVEGQATVIWLMPEGSVVKKGDKLVELDASDLVERKATQEISLERAQAALVEAEQNLEIQKKEITASEETAKSVLTIALMDQEKFLGKLRKHSGADGHGQSETGPSVENGNGTGEPAKVAKATAQDQKAVEDGTNREMITKLGALVKGGPLASLVDKALELLGPAENLDRDMGEMAQSVLEQIDKVRLAEADLKLKETTLAYSEELYKKSYIARQERDKDRLDWQRGVSQVTLARNELDLLINYTLKTQQIELQQAVNNARLEYERVVASNIARRAREKADFASKQAEFKLAKERFDNLVQQIDNALIYAPGPGLVVYAQQGDGRRGREVVEEGGTVHRRQTLIKLPDVTRMVCDLKVKEAEVDKVAPGQAVAIKLDAFPGRTFTGKVTRVSPLPDAGSRWSNNDRKVYKTQVALDPNEASLRPGMAAHVEIVITEIEGALAVPMTAVRRQGSVHYVWKLTNDVPKAVEVELGQNNPTHVQIVRGVSDGDEVFLAPPEGVEAPKFEQPEEESVKTAGSEKKDTNGEVQPALAKVGQSQTTGPGQRGQRQRGPGQAGVRQGGRRPGRRPMSSPAFDELLRMLAKKLPERAGEFKDARAFFQVMRDPDVAGLLESDPEISAKWTEIQSSFRRRTGGSRGGRAPGGRNPGDRDG